MLFGVFEVKGLIIRPIHRDCSGIADQERSEGGIQVQRCRHRSLCVGSHLWVRRTDAIAMPRALAEKDAKHNDAAPYTAADLEPFRIQTVPDTSGPRRGAAGSRYDAGCLLSLVHDRGQWRRALGLWLLENAPFRDVHIVLVRGDLHCAADVGHVVLRALARNRLHFDAADMHAHRSRSPHRHASVLETEESALELHHRFRLNYYGRALGVDVGLEPWFGLEQISGEDHRGSRDLEAVNPDPTLAVQYGGARVRRRERKRAQDHHHPANKFSYNRHTHG